MNIFKKLRKEHGLTQDELAKKLNLNQTTVGKWENDNLHVLPDYPTLLALSKLYGVSTDYLLDNEVESQTNFDIEYKYNLSNNLRVLRKQFNFSQQDLAEKLNISQPGYAKYENGLAEPDIKSLVTVSKIYNISIDSLLGNSSEQSKITPEQAKDIWLASLPQDQQELINAIVNFLQKKK